MELFRASTTTHTGAVFSSKLATSVTVGWMGITLPTGDGSVLPMPDAGNFFRVRVGSNALYEIKTVGFRDGDTLACDPFENAWPADTPVIWTIAGETLEEMRLAGMPFTDRPSSSTYPYDDDFEGASLDPKWAEAGSDDYHTAGGYFVAPTSPDMNTRWPSYYSLVLDNSSSTQKGASLTEALPGWTTGDTFSVTAKLVGRMFVDGAGMSVSVLDSVGSAGVRAAAVRSSAVGPDPLVHGEVHGKVSGSWVSHSSAKAFSSADAVYLHLSKDASDVWTAWFSSDGLVWHDSGTFSPDVFTADRLVVAWFANTDARKCRFGIDWVRFNWLTLP